MQPRCTRTPPSVLVLTRWHVGTHQLSKQELRGRGRESHVGLHLPNEEGSLWKQLESVQLNPSHGVRLREAQVPVRAWGVRCA